MDYTPYAVKRDNKIVKFCKSKKFIYTICEDYLLSHIGDLNKSDGDAYTVYTPFRNNAIKQNYDRPAKTTVRNLSRSNKLSDDGYIKYSINDNILVSGGRKEGLRMLSLIKQQKQYNRDRNTLSIETTLLSAYIKFGCISIREAYWKIKDKLGTKNDLVSQLFWREFYFYIGYYFPYVIGNNYNGRYDKIKWNRLGKNFEHWCNGETGYPVVDAGMRQLNETGYMHNRARLITSNFMNRMLGYDWKAGEKYYATRLTDYDPLVNNGNWQWISSTGVDPKPYFQRLFNPWLQSKKFDADAEYIKTWIPELKKVPAEHIHRWDKYCDQYDLKELGYKKPIVDYDEARKESVKMYRKV
jgi:deoxyribodipyrimidine photo-lyase